MSQDPPAPALAGHATHPRQVHRGALGGRVGAEAGVEDLAIDDELGIGLGRLAAPCGVTGHLRAHRAQCSFEPRRPQALEGARRKPFERRVGPGPRDEGGAVPRPHQPHRNRRARRPAAENDDIGPRRHAPRPPRDAGTGASPRGSDAATQPRCAWRGGKRSGWRISARISRLRASRGPGRSK